MPEASQKERAVVLADWPQPAVVAEPRVYADDRCLMIHYRTAEDRFVIVHFPLCTHVAFGAPNDEALSGHPLYGRGLEFYSVHRVVESSLIELLEHRNSVHPQHNRARYLQDLTHYIFTFQDSTLECVVTEGMWKPTLKVFDSENQAEQEWLHTVTMGA
jgi:hypothetical protein